MSTVDIAQLNTRFSVAGQVQFVDGPGGLPVVQITNQYATATIALHGAQVTTYQPTGQEPVLFVSKQAMYQVGKAIRGGIPISFPWFAKEGVEQDKPMHGFARVRMWHVVQVTPGADTTTIELELRYDGDLPKLWSAPFELNLTVSVGRELRLDLTARNTSGQAVSITDALHTYFFVGDIAKVAIHGLDGTRYSDKLDGQEKIQEGPITIARRTDRIYHDTIATCVIEDTALKRRIVVAKEGSRSTVVWNPWVENARNLADMADDEYQQMVCVETTNAGFDSVYLPPGGTHTLTTIIHVEPLS